MKAEQIESQRYRAFLNFWCLVFGSFANVFQFWKLHENRTPDVTFSKASK